jgi:hypothetical protein
VRKHLDVLHRCRWKDAVPEIEDVASAFPDPTEHGVGLLHHPRRRAEQ